MPIDLVPWSGWLKCLSKAISLIYRPDDGQVNRRVQMAVANSARQTSSICGMAHLTNLLYVYIIIPSVAL